ncbi:hypothetical protein NQ317_004718 [Molorchus minor]|uniref:Ketoreductase domain-containing protein n=1 Tax=Molorchus minor TaxID=1323400 RepID=A0ABQ9JNA9_9CUCU|nr:hypothetical protein NQ317_004718 [Molorchus minor]
MFSGKVVLITGGSSGIGAATAVEFSSSGASVVITGRNIQNLEEVAGICAKKPLVIQGDLNKQEDSQAIIDTIMKEFGKLDILVNNAGIIESGGIENTNLGQYDRIFDTNVRSVYHLTTIAVPHLIKTKGNIVNVSSVTGIRASSNLLAYCMSKAAIDQFTRCVALDLAPKQVRVNGVNPGVVITELHKRGGMSEEQYSEFLQRCEQTHPLGRPGKAEEVAKAIVFLAGDHSSFITGATLTVDGGRQLMCPR